jgi:hypothetical protein
MLYASSTIIILWGIAHIAIPTKDIIKGFGPISMENKRILAMEWIMEGLTLCFIGLLVFLITRASFKTIQDLTKFLELCASRALGCHLSLLCSDFAVLC